MSNRSFNKMALKSLVLYLAMFSCLQTRALCQVTFSRDWNAGKRSPPPDLQCNAVIKSMNEICQLFVEEFRQLAACEVKNLHFQRNYDEKQAELFLDGQEGR